MIKVDVLIRDSDEDTLALVTLSEPLRDLYDKCIRPKRGRIAAGFIPVGDYKLLKLVVGPATSSELIALPLA